MAADDFNKASCVAELQSFNDDYAEWDAERFASLDRGNSILAGTDNNTYQQFCKAYRAAEALADVNPAAKAEIDRSRSIFTAARKAGLTLTTGPFAGPL